MYPDPWLFDGCPRTATLDVDWLWRRVRRAPHLITEELRSRELNVRDPSDLEKNKFLQVTKYLSRAPTLEGVLGEVVGEVILLDAPPGYDISHSEPRWPRTIFVSSPKESEKAASLRLLENVVHEAMHLQLTNHETANRLVLVRAPRLFSPWKQCDRDARGVLHGVYVFVCISAMFDRRAFVDQLDATGRLYARRRCKEIAAELSTVDMRRLAEALTQSGRTILDKLLAVREHLTEN